MRNRQEFEMLKKVSNMPWCQDDPDKVGAAVVDLILDQEPFINKWAWKWFEALQFVYGNHNVKYSRRYGMAVDVDFLRGNNKHVSQKSQTNLAKIVAEALSSMIYSRSPKWEAIAQDERLAQSSRFSHTVQSILDAYVHINNMDDTFQTAATSYTTYGQCAAEIYWDHSCGRMIKVPVYQNGQLTSYRTGLTQEPMLGGVLSQVQPALGSDGQPMQGETFFPVSDEQGSPQYRNVFLGAPKIDILTPFEYRREPGSQSMNTAKWIQRIRVIDFDDWLLKYGEISGQTKHFNSVEPENMSRIVQSFAIRHFLRSYQLSPSFEDGSRDLGHRFTDYLRKKIVVIEHWDRPTPMWPKGRRVIVANGFCTHITEPQYSTNKEGGWHPFVECQWFNVAPSIMAIGPLHDVIEKNKQLNITDSLIATSLLRNMGSKLLIRTGSGLDKDKISGTPGEILETNDLDAAKYLHDAQPIPAVINVLREEYKNDTYESSGAGDALRGQRTVGVSSGYAYRQAMEREEKRLAPARKRFEKFIGNAGEKFISCLKANALELGDDIVGYLKTHSAGKFSTQDVVTFMATPMNFGVDIVVQGGSMELKSKATKQANLQELAKGPLGQRLMNDAYVAEKYLKEFDAENLRDLSGAHRDRVQRENEIWGDMLKLGPTAKVELIPVVLDRDDHDIHMSLHTNWIIENDSDLIQNPWLLETAILHIEQHRIQKKELEGALPPGTSGVVPQLAQYGAQQPNLAGVIAEKQQGDQKKAQQQQPQQPQPQPQQNVTPTSGGPQAGNGKAAPAASNPPPPGGTQPQTPASAPSANTPSGRGQVGGNFQ